jgi:TatD DNase family protein
VNLAHESFDPDRVEVIARARAAGVVRMIVTGSTLESSAVAQQLAQQNAALFATAGVHPHHAGEIGARDRSVLEYLAARPGVVAVGECGLDYYRDLSPRTAQDVAFRMQLEIAVETGLPVFLHQRDAHRPCIAVLDEYRGHELRGVAHCFTGGPDELRDYLDRGLYIGITGWLCDEQRGEALRSAVRELPLDRVLIETDAPYLLPKDLRPKPATRRNEPMHLPHILRALAQHMEVDPERLAEATTRNAEALFGLGYNAPLNPH